MKILLVASSIIVPIVMLYLIQKSDKFNLIFNSIAVLSTIIFGAIASTAIYQVISDGKVFMTTIHGLFLNPFFLTTGAYIGVFLLYRLIRITLDER